MVAMQNGLNTFFWEKLTITVSAMGHAWPHHKAFDIYCWFRKLFISNFHIFFLQPSESVEAARCLPGQHSASYSHTYSHCLSSISHPSPFELWDHATQSGDPAPDQGEEGGSRWRRISGCYSFLFLLNIQIKFKHFLRVKEILYLQLPLIL